LVQKVELLENAMNSAEAADRRYNECREMLEIARSENEMLQGEVERLRSKLCEIGSFGPARVDLNMMPDVVTWNGVCERET
jgi:hypothetical protein